MATPELQQLIKRLEGIQKDLGGPLDDLRSKKDTDEFNSIKLSLCETFNSIKKKQEEKDEAVAKFGRNLIVIKAEVALKDSLLEAQEQLAQLQQALRRQKKNPKKHPHGEIEIKEKQYENYKNMLEQLKNREEGGGGNEHEGTMLSLDHGFTKLMGTRKHDPLPPRDLDETEQDALKRFQENDRKLDQMLGEVEDGLTALGNKALAMGDQIAHQEILIGGLDEEVTKTNKEIETANQRLRKVLFEYKKPASFCMDIICFLIFLGLIGVIIKLATQK